MDLIIRPSALKHGLTCESITHAVENALAVDEEFSDDDPPKVLVLGPDNAANIIEIVGVYDSPDTFTIFHAMPARKGYLIMLDRKENQ